ncbi:basic proline-rich protein-like [Hippopotamus amphibius kiboko]|uniref:basic proline-rich protein-like n=1 Tax=Hippopotamus amphibius kiboko TaxID=575201 RepID=UPI002598D57E|nr:basic proline-rich protein-like [Hippopotamus amphibius kiboko]
MATDPRRDSALGPTSQCPARCCRPGSPCPHEGHLRRQIHGDPSEWRCRSSPCTGPPSATKGPHRAGGWPRTGRPYRREARRTSQAGAREAGAGPDPFKAEPNPRAAGSQGRRAGWPRTGGGGWRPPTCPSAAAGSRWPPAGHVDAPSSPTAPRSRAPAAAPRALHPAHPRRRRPHTELARGRRGLLNPDRTTAPGGGAQGGPSGWARERGLPSPGPGEAQCAARASVSSPGPSPASPPPSLNGRVRGARLSPHPPCPPARRLPQPWDPYARATPPSGPGRAVASGARRPRPGARRRARGHLPPVRGLPCPGPSGAHPPGPLGPGSGHSPPDGP